ncbi:MAG: UDP-3-O-(3-hydroxymyristoyl)glucosamine N-acyltransferase [Fibrobacteraceae bacterium]
MQPVRVSEIASFLEGSLEWSGVAMDFDVDGFAPVEQAQSTDIAFWTENSISGNIRHSHAGLLLVRETFEGKPEDVQILLRVKNPYHAMVCFLEKYYAPFVKYQEPTIAPSAVIHPTAVVEGTVGDRCVIGPYCIIPRGATLGNDCILESRVTLYPQVVLGDCCVVQSGVVIGSRGFGFYDYEGVRRPVPHFGGVCVGDDCSFGANMVVAAGFLSPTRIGCSCHFDSFVQIGHNCSLGNFIYMASQSGLAGGVIVEDHVELGGGAQVAGHITLGNHVTIAAKSGVIKSVPSGSTMAGFPAVPIEAWRRQEVALRKMGRL